MPQTRRGNPLKRLRRRELLRAGLGGFASLSLADVLRRQAAANEAGGGKQAAGGR